MLNTQLMPSLAVLDTPFLIEYYIVALLLWRTMHLLYFFLQSDDKIISIFSNINGTVYVYALPYILQLSHLYIIITAFKKVNPQISPKPFF